MKKYNLFNYRERDDFYNNLEFTEGSIMEYEIKSPNNLSRSCSHFSSKSNGTPNKNRRHMSFKGQNFKKWLHHSKSLQCPHTKISDKKVVLKRKLRSIKFLSHIERKKTRINKIVGDSSLNKNKS